jgi:magnesium-transporting ATPase (P-type)
MTPVTQDRPAAEQEARSRTRVLAWLALAFGIVAFTGLWIALLRRWRSAKRLPTRPRPLPPQPQAVLDLQGLTEEEAAARQLEGQDNAVHFKPAYTTRQILRANSLTIFNLSMVGLAVVQVLLGKPFDAVLTMLVMFLGIGMNVGQQLWARGRLKTLEGTTRTQATVVRGGLVRSIDPGQVVRGDVLVVGPGDQILADGQVLGTGQIVVDESMLTGDPRQHTKLAAEPVYAGSFCLAGHGAYEAQKVGNERLIEALTGEFQAVEEELTPLERTMDRLLRVLLVIVAVLSLLLLADYFDLLLPGIHLDDFASAASVIFSIAPSSLFLMILVNYAMGTADLARVGALVHRSRSVESLAQSTVICFAQAGILTGIELKVEPIETTDAPLGEARIRQILGDYAHSTSASSPAVRAIGAAFPGGQRRVVDEAPFLSLFGWSAVAFDEDGLRGVYVLGDPDLLESYLRADEAPSTELPQEVPEGVSWRERVKDLWQGFRQSAGGTPAEVSGEQSPEEPARGGFAQRFMDQIGLTLGQPEVEPETEAQPPPRVEEAVYLVAYHPDLVPLHTASGQPHLPQDLIPLCRLRYSEQVRPEAVEAVRALSQTEVGLKVFSAEEPERTVDLLQRVGLGGAGGTQPRMISGPELALLDRTGFGRAAMENAIFGRVTPEQARQVVDALREQGEAVAVLGDGVNDLAAMRQAQLSIARKNSSPAALSVADIILLEDSSQALLRVFDKGQRIANGLLDVLKLYLNQVGYLTLLILAIWGMEQGFPYQSKQGTLITIGSVILPSLALVLWAPAGVVPRTHLGWLLARVVVPSAMTISAATVLVYRFFALTMGDVAYAQLAVTYTLTISGLVLVILLRPPFRGLTLVGMGQSERSGDWRPTVMVLVLLVLVFVAAQIPLADDLVGLKPLQQPGDYVVVGLAVLAWASAAVFLWWVRPLERLLRRFLQ